MVIGDGKRRRAVSGGRLLVCLTLSAALVAPHRTAAAQSYPDDWYARVENAAIHLDDVTGYTETQGAWRDDAYSFVFAATGTTAIRGPLRIDGGLILTGDPEGAQLAFTNFVPEGTVEAPLPGSFGSNARAFISEEVGITGVPLTRAVVLFYVDNVVGFVRVQGESSVTRVDQAARLAELMISRLATP
jgi:hypothetical protein